MTTKVGLPLQFSRNYSAPLDSLSVFDNISALNSSINSSFSYPGMVATVKDSENDGKIFILNSTKTQWLQVSGSTSGSSNITTLGTIATGTWNSSNISLAKGGTGATDAATARTNLGLAIGTNVQAYNATLGSVAAGTYTGATDIERFGTVATGTWNAAVIAVAKGGTGATDATTARTNLGVRIGTDVQAYSDVLSSIAAGNYIDNITIVGTVTTGTWDAGTISANRGVTGATDATTARTNLGLAIGTNVQAYSAVLGSVAAGNYIGDDNITTLGTIATGTWNSSNISVAKGGTGATDATTARTNLGLAIGTNVQAYSAVLGSVAAGNYIGDDNIATVGTVTTGTWNSGNISVAKCGTGATDATLARTNLGLAIGTNVQAYSAVLGSLEAGNYAGSSNINTLGTVTTGTWSGLPIDTSKGGLTDFQNWGVFEATTFLNNPALSARNTLDLTIGTNVQAYSAILGSVAAGNYIGDDNITTLGTITTGTWNAANVAVAKGGTGATNATTARTNLGLAIGTNVQAYSAALGSIAAGNYTGDDSITTVGTITTGTWNGSTISTSYGGTGVTTASAARTYLELGTISSQNFNNVSISGGSADNLVIGNISENRSKFSTLEIDKIQINNNTISSSTNVLYFGGNVSLQEKTLDVYQIVKRNNKKLKLTELSRYTIQDLGTNIHPSSVAWNGSSLVIATYNDSSNANNVAVYTVPISDYATDGSQFVFIEPGFGSINVANGGYTGLCMQNQRIDGGGCVAVGGSYYASPPYYSSTPHVFTSLNQEQAINGSQYDSYIESNSIRSFRISDGYNAWNYPWTGNGAALGLAIDPGYNLQEYEYGIAWLTKFSGKRLLVDLDSGFPIYDSSSGFTIDNSSTNWRDLDFNPRNGDLYARKTGSIVRTWRFAGNSIRHVETLKYLSNESEQTTFGQNIRYLSNINGFVDDAIIYNINEPNISSSNIESYIKFINPLNGNEIPTEWQFPSEIFSNGTIYDFDWDENTQTLAVCDFYNKIVSILKLESFSTDSNGNIIVESSNAEVGFVDISSGTGLSIDQTFVVRDITPPYNAAKFASYTQGSNVITLSSTISWNGATIDRVNTTVDQTYNFGPEDTSRIVVGAEVFVFGFVGQRPFQLGTRVTSTNSSSNTLTISVPADLSSTVASSPYKVGNELLLLFRYLKESLIIDDNIIGLPKNGQLMMFEGSLIPFGPGGAFSTFTNYASQSTKYSIILSGSTIGEETKILTSDGLDAYGIHLLENDTNIPTIPDQSTWNFTAKIVAYSENLQMGGIDSAGFNIKGICRNNKSNQISIIPSLITESWRESNLEACSVNVATNGSQLEFIVNGVDETNISWTCSLEVCHSQYLDPTDSAGGTGGGGV